MTWTIDVAPYMIQAVEFNSALQLPKRTFCRYQYLSLVYFLSKGRYMAPWAHTSQPSLAIEKEWDSWEDFFKTGSLQLSIVSVTSDQLAYYVWISLLDSQVTLTKATQRSHMAILCTAFYLVDLSLTYIKVSSISRACKNVLLHCECNCAACLTW